MKEKTKIVKYTLSYIPEEIDLIDAFMMCSSSDHTVYGADDIKQCSKEKGFPIPINTLSGHIFKYYVSPIVTTEIAVAYYDMFDSQEMQ